MRMHIAPRRARIALAAALLGFSPAGAFAQTSHPWAGLFVGAEITGSLDSVSTTETKAKTAAVFHQFNASANGAGGGVNLGYNWQPWGNALVVGAVASLDALDNSGGRVFRTADDLAGFVEARAGYLSSPNLLWYGQAGLAVARESAKIDFGAGVTSQSRTVTGYALGGGAEWGLPVARTSLFLDYRHIWWGSGTAATPAAAPALDFRWQRDGNLVKAGLRLYFD